MYQQRSLILLPNHLHGQYSQSICNEFLRVSIFWIRSAKIFTMYIKDLGSVFIASAPQIGKEHTNMYSLLWITQIHQHAGGWIRNLITKQWWIPRAPLGVQVLSISCIFWENLANRMLALPPPWRVGAPTLGKSWICYFKESYLPLSMFVVNTLFEW